MKKTHYLLLPTLIAMVAAVVFISPKKAVSQKKNTAEAYSIPGDVAQILKHSCASCHNAGGNGMAESMWSFSSWDSYSAKKQSKKAKSICKAISNGIMPPASVEQDRRPTAEQKEIICKWSASLQLKK
jgi:hypothetical protein